MGFDSINLIDLLLLRLGLRVSLNSGGGNPTGMSNSSHDHRSEDTKQDYGFIYNTHISICTHHELITSSNGSDTTVGIWGLKTKFFSP